MSKGGQKDPPFLFYREFFEKRLDILIIIHYLIVLIGGNHDTKWRIYKRIEGTAEEV